MMNKKTDGSWSYSVFCFLYSDFHSSFIIPHSSFVFLWFQTRRKKN